MTARWAPRVVSLAFIALGSSAMSALLPADGLAQQTCTPSGLTTPRAWSAPLDRIIPVRARNVALRDAIDRIAAAGRFRISYSSAFLPLDRRVCLSVDSMSAGDALAEILAGVSVSALVTSLDQVVIAPNQAAERGVDRPVQTLERVVVTGSATGNAQRPLPIALDVLDGKKLAERASSTLSSTFDGNVPGLWMWERSPSSMLARYGSIRGASSFNVSYPKVYIDGIEVANPLLVTEVNPAVLDRIEVIRGPQGAALYGADAISGVINIITRHEGLQAGAARTQISSGAGFSQTAVRGPRSVLAQNHSAQLRAGSSMRSGSLGLSVTTLGDYLPEAYSRDLKLNGGMRWITSAASWTGTARLNAKRAASGQNPWLRGFAQPGTSSIGVLKQRASFAIAADTTRPTARDSLPQSVREYTIGGTATILTGGRWTPSLTVGVDGYRLTNVPNDLAPVPWSLDSALHDGSGGADRGTMRASLVGQFAAARRESLTMTLAAEHSEMRERLGSVKAGLPEATTWRTNTGLVAQGNLSIANAAFVTGGFRLEHNVHDDGLTVKKNTVLLPMVGVAGVRDVGDVSYKVRAAYGVGIRPANTSAREMALRDIRRYLAAPALDPEEQSGTEVGADVMVGKRFAVHLTRFDQTASGLIQPVTIPDSQSGPTGPGSGKRLAYVLQNVGEISNHGWELESSLNLGVLSLSGALSTVDSRVQQISRWYTGDMRPGDRMLAVPSKTASLSASWSGSAWYMSATLSRAFDWTNYDRRRLAANYATCSTCTARSFSGDSLRSYWIRYDGVTRLRATLSRDLLRDLSLKVTADNLTNVQEGEPDNITVLPGRTVLVGLSARIR